MTAPISPINGSSQQAASLQGLTPAALPTDGASSGPSTVAGASASLSSSTAIMSVQSSVTQMLQSVGGGIENNEALRMLIATLIVLAMLQELLKDDEAGGKQSSSMQLPGQGNGNRSAFVGLYYSSSTVSYQQSTTTVLSVGGSQTLSGTAGQSPSGVEDPGSGLDVST